MRPSLFWYVKQSRFLDIYGRFGTTYRSRIQVLEYGTDRLFPKSL